MDKDISLMTKKELKELEFFKPTEKFNSVVILPEGKKHDSGYECMSFILCDHHRIVGKVGGYSDVIHINGIGRLWRLEKRFQRANKAYCLEYRLFT